MYLQRAVVAENTAENRAFEPIVIIYLYIVKLQTV